MLTIWGRINSHNVKKVVWLAEEIGLPHQRIDMGGQFGFTDAYLAANPNRLIPTIDDDGFVLWESNAILRYLADRYGPEFQPADAQQRAAADKWMDWQFSFADAQRNAFIGLVRKKPEERDENAIAASASAAGKMVAILEAELERQPWLSGKRFGIGDIPMGVYIHTWLTLPIERAERPAVKDWYARLRKREAFDRIAQVPLT
ncbi:glutathione S-transferase family protein [Qipengyuania soli]|uniref:Glutathione S-transferase family protein n=1 Tax=Qipengyuania soli TaxID=2782568 RepID=A0A7S8F617_9SPHN|nr:glutathione S-transferase family protein [Qipengyuania soli]QPC99803.1 glutathione S-transferase family protein [Qipengyuania soli]